MGAGDEHLGALGGLADLYHVDLQALVFHVALPLHLLAGGEVGVGKLRAGVQTQGD